MKVVCPYCSNDAELVGGVVIYPHRQDLYRKPFWFCPPCKAWVGCHPGTNNPLGRLADAELRAAKMDAHAAFDPIWQQGKMRRKEAYRWLAAKLNLREDECHIGMFNVDSCRAVVRVCEERRSSRQVVPPLPEAAVHYVHPGAGPAPEQKEENVSPTNNGSDDSTYNFTTDHSIVRSVLTCFYRKSPPGLCQVVMDEMRFHHPRSSKVLDACDELLHTKNRPVGSSHDAPARPPLRLAPLMPQPSLIPPLVPLLGSAFSPPPSPPPVPAQPLILPSKPSIFDAASASPRASKSARIAAEQMRDRFTEAAHAYPEELYPLFINPPVVTYDNVVMIAIACGLVHDPRGLGYDHGFEMKSSGVAGKGEMVRASSPRLLRDDLGQPCIYTRGQEEKEPAGIKGFMRLIRYEEGVLIRFWFREQGGKAVPENDRFFQVVRGQFIPITREQYWSGQGKSSAA